MNAKSGHFKLKSPEVLFLFLNNELYFRVKFYAHSKIEQSTESSYTCIASSIIYLPH
jgi:hypothetical protein